MSNSSSGLRFEAGALTLPTPWAAPAKGDILVNGQCVAGPWKAEGDAWTCGHGPWTLTIEPERSAAFSLRIANRSDAAQRLQSVSFARWRPERFRPALDAAEFREFIHGGSFLRMASGVKPVGRKTPFLDFTAASNIVIAYQRDDGGALLLAVLPPIREAFSEFVTLHSEPHLEADFGVDARHVFDCVVEPGRAARTAALAALAGDDAVELLERLGDLWAERAPSPARRPPRVGWNSWDFYAGAVTRRDMDANLAAARRLFGDALEVFAIDEGWEAQWGAWEPNRKFDEGLEDFCRSVKAAGGVPGVWSAPLLVNTYNPLFLEHPDWFAEREDGQLQTDLYGYGPMAYLDVTRPEVIEHVKGVFRRLRAAGFEYFKVDFSHCILKARKFADPSIPRVDLVRRAFAAIREAIGPEPYLLSCGSPYESVVGLVDAVRASGDIHIYWGHVLRNAGALAARWWMQGKVWNCDPDFLVVRGPDTADPPFGRRQVVKPMCPPDTWVTGREFNLEEARAYALLVHLSGGDVILGDALDQLKPAGVEMLRRVLQPRRPPARPVDLFTSDQMLPRIWISRGERDALVGVFNWLDTPARLDFRPGDYGLSGPARDFWTDEPVAVLPQRMPRRRSFAWRFSS